MRFRHVTGVVSPPELSLQDDAAQGEQRAQDALRAAALPEGLEPSNQQVVDTAGHGR
jgi:hypothetical protein